MEINRLKILVNTSPYILAQLVGKIPKIVKSNFKKSFHFQLLLFKTLTFHKVV